MLFPNRTDSDIGRREHCTDPDRREDDQKIPMGEQLYRHRGEEKLSLGSLHFQGLIPCFFIS